MLLLQGAAAARAAVHQRSLKALGLLLRSVQLSIRRFDRLQPADMRGALLQCALVAEPLAIPSLQV